MSTLNVESISHPTSGSLVTINGTAPSNRNLIINGAMQVAQRGTTFTGHTSGNTLDMWKFSDGTSAVFDVAQSSTAPAGFTTSLKVDCTTTGTPTGTQETFVETKVEAQNLQHLQYGTSGAQTTTLSFWVRSNKTGDYGLWFYHYDLPGQYATTYTISSADTWEYKTITLPGNTTAAFANDNSTGLAIRFYLQIGPDRAGTPSETWQTTLSNRSPDLNLGDSTSNEWLITGVQLEVGSVATPFEHRSYGDELARCERYYQVFTNGVNDRALGTGCFYTTTTLVCAFPFRTTMRANPTIDATNGGSPSPFTFYIHGIGHNTATVTAGGGTTPYVAGIRPSSAVSGTQGSAGEFKTSNAAAHLAFSAEL